MQRPDEQKPQTVTFPNGTMFGGASGSQASTLAQLVVDSNNNNIKDYEQLQGTASKNLQTSQQALQMLEHLSQQQGTGDITLFFPTGSAALPTSGLQYQRLINFVDYLSRNRRGRKILLIMIGSASATGSMSINQKLSQERSQAPEPIIDQYLVNDPHQFFKVYCYRRHVQSQKRELAGRPALPERAHHCRVRHQSDSRAAGITGALKTGPTLRCRFGYWTKVQDAAMPFLSVRIQASGADEQEQTELTEKKILCFLCYLV